MEQKTKPILTKPGPGLTSASFNEHLLPRHQTRFRSLRCETWCHGGRPDSSLAWPGGLKVLNAILFFRSFITHLRLPAVGFFLPLVASSTTGHEYQPNNTQLQRAPRHTLRHER